MPPPRRPWSPSRLRSQYAGLAGKQTGVVRKDADRWRGVGCESATRSSECRRHDEGRQNEHRVQPALPMSAPFRSPGFEGGGEAASSAYRILCLLARFRRLPYRVDHLNEESHASLDTTMPLLSYRVQASLGACEMCAVTPRCGTVRHGDLWAPVAVLHFAGISGKLSELKRPNDRVAIADPSTKTRRGGV
jgi:hypothetical protein